MTESRRGWLVVVIAGWGLAGCGAEAQTPPASADQAPSEPASEAASVVAKRLEGSWEIARYESSDPIPPEAMELMGQMFEELVLRFEGQSVTVGSETTPFSVADEADSEFTLVAQGGMFDGARCKFVSDDELEINDQGAQWAGVTTLKRLP